MTPKELYEAGRLDEAIAALSRSLRENPSDTSHRGFLAELLCVAGDFERADAQLDVLADQVPENAVGVAQFRQLIRASLARQQFFNERRLPELLAPPSPALRLYLEASVFLLDGDTDTAGRLLERAEGERLRPRGTCNGVPFDDLRDLDDLTAGILEVLTNTGKYYWVPLDHISRLELTPPVCARDLLWREARLEVVGGPDGQVFVPAVYHTAATNDESALLGRRTDWTESSDGPVRGIGQRTFLVGKNALGIMMIEEIIFDTDRSPASQPLS